MLRNYMCSGNPVILALELDNNLQDGPDHSVVATGEAYIGSTVTWSIWDPGRYNALDLRPFGNTYQGIRLLSPNPATRALFLGTIPTVQFLVTDPDGRRTGFDPAISAIVHEIPESAYAFEHVVDDEVPNGPASPTQYIFELFHPLQGTYTIQIWGSASAAYAAYFFGYDAAGNSLTGDDVRMSTPGSVQTYMVDYTSIVGQQMTVQLAVTIDIKPGCEPNSVGLRSRGKIPVAILSTAWFDAPTQEDMQSLTFGHSGDEDSLAGRGGQAQPNCAPADVNGDGLSDLVCHFFSERTHLAIGDTTGTLKGQTSHGTAIVGRDEVMLVP